MRVASLFKSFLHIKKSWKSKNGTGEGEHRANPSSRSQSSSPAASERTRGRFDKPGITDSTKGRPNEAGMTDVTQERVIEYGMTDASQQQGRNPGRSGL